MKIIIENIKLRPDQDETCLGIILYERFSIESPQFKILRKSLDARKKNKIVYTYRLLVELHEEKAAALLKDRDVSVFCQKNLPEKKRLHNQSKHIIIGSGPAGLFCALRLIEAGATVEIFERGKPVEKRMADISHLEKNGILDPESNVLFGEGGAGTYSDGKLTTRINKPEISWLFEKFVEHGAQPSILYDARPHIGTDVLRKVIKNIRNTIAASGSHIHFSEKVTDIQVLNGRIEGICTSSGKEIKTSKLILATGHSARDIYELLEQKGIALEKKGFAVGVRIEHPSEIINRIQYGDSPYLDMLPAADYRLTFNNKKTGRGIYSFCMCPGGSIINSSSEPGRLNINGMSLSNRSSSFSNSAIVVTVAKNDIPGSPASGIQFQRDIEKAAFEAGGGDYIAPAQTVKSFLTSAEKNILPEVSYLPGVKPAPVSDYLPEWITSEIRNALGMFNRKMKGFISEKAVIVGAETRTSSPVRISRDENYQSVNVRGLFPAGEGSGYAGGIVSSAVDGIKIADIITDLNKQVS